MLAFSQRLGSDTSFFASMVEFVVTIFRLSWKVMIDRLESILFNVHTSQQAKVFTTDGTLSTKKAETINEIEICFHLYASLKEWLYLAQHVLDWYF